MTFNRLQKKLTIPFKASLLCLLLAVVLCFKAGAQPIPVGDLKEQQYRLLQLLADSTIETSFINRPIWNSTYHHIFEQNNLDQYGWWGQPLASKGMHFSPMGYDMTVGAYQPEITETYNSELPYGENNGAAWYGKGLNSELHAGLYLTSDYVTITFRPHLIYTENADFKPPRFIPRYSNGDIRYVEPGRLPEDSLAERIDRPFRFGPDSYGTIDWGQSSVRLHYNAIEAGLSNETLWWGPGVKYALAMSNNAAGLPHAFLGTREPIDLPFNVGDLEFRWIFAWPQDSQFFDLDAYGPANPEVRRQKLKILNSTRFTNGLNVVYSPSFLPNLSVGVSRIIHQYIPEGGLSVGDDLLAVFKAFPKPGNEVLENPRDDSHFEEKNPIASVFARWVLPESNAEFYAELYKGDHNVSFRDFLMEPQHGRAYTLGLQKVLEFGGPVNFVKVNAEVNSLLPGQVDDVRPQTYYYTHATVKQGHTNRGEVLGAAIGPGSSSQYIGVDGYFDQGKIGFFVQRVVLNNHFHYEHQQRFFPAGGFKDQFHHRINLNIGFDASYKVGPVLLNGGIIWNRNFNYGRFDLGKRSFYTTPVDIIDNFQYQLSARYLF